MRRAFTEIYPAITAPYMRRRKNSLRHVRVTFYRRTS